MSTTDEKTLGGGIAGATSGGEGRASGPAIRVFEPALCCNTGVCGPDVDEALIGFTADLDHLRSAGVNIARVNLANDPMAFAQNPVVVNFLRVVGSSGLPLVLVDDVTVATGRYPDRAELRRLAGLAGDQGAQTADPSLATSNLATSNRATSNLATSSLAGLDLGLQASGQQAGGCCGDTASSGCC